MGLAMYRVVKGFTVYFRRVYFYMQIRDHFWGSRRWVFETAKLASCSRTELLSTKKRVKLIYFCYQGLLTSSQTFFYILGNFMFFTCEKKCYPFLAASFYWKAAWVRKIFHFCKEKKRKQWWRLLCTNYDVEKCGWDASFLPAFVRAMAASPNKAATQDTKNKFVTLPVCVLTGLCFLQKSFLHELRLYRILRCSSGIEIYGLFRILSPPNPTEVKMRYSFPRWHGDNSDLQKFLFCVRLKSRYHNALAFSRQRQFFLSFCDTFSSQHKLFSFRPGCFCDAVFAIYFK